MKETSDHDKPPVLARDRARALRASQTEVERQLWQRLRNRQLNGTKFRRQHPIGSYVADFFSLDARLVIELDGSQHGDESERRADERRTEYLESQGYRVLRFWNERFWTTLMVCSKLLPAIFKYEVPHPEYEVPHPALRADLSRQGPTGRGIEGRTLFDLFQRSVAMSLARDKYGAPQPYAYPASRRFVI